MLALTGRLREFDVGVAAQPTMYGSLPATLFPSPGTAVSATILWVTPAQFTQLTWSEFTYRLGRLRTRFEVEETGAGFDQVLVFVSRFGAFCPDGEPVALAAMPADGPRRAGAERGATARPRRRARARPRGGRRDPRSGRSSRAPPRPPRGSPPRCTGRRCLQLSALDPVRFEGQNPGRSSA